MSVVVVVVVDVVSIGAGGGGGGVVVVVVVVDTESPVVASSWLALPHDDKLRATTAPSTNKLRSLMAITSVNKLRKHHSPIWLRDASGKVNYYILNRTDANIRKLWSRKQNFAKVTIRVE